MEEQVISPSSSSIDSCNHPASSTASSLTQSTRRDLSTDLRLGLSLSTSCSSLQRYLLLLCHPLPSLLICSPITRSPLDHLPDWPPIKPVLRTALADRGNHRIRRNSTSFFVKVYMEGIQIGRKLDLFAHDGYESLIKSLQQMFRATIICAELAQGPSSRAHVLTYEDKEGDWMMVGDVPWELFLTTVKKLKITRADKC